METSIEVANHGHPHIESHHSGERTSFCLLSNGDCGITVNIEATGKEQKFLEDALLTAMQYLDKFFDGDSARTLKGLVVTVGDGLTESGGQAFPEKNKVVLDRQKMLNTMSDADELLASQGMLQVDERLSSVPEEHKDSSIALYEVIHEIGHIVEGRADLDLPIESRMQRASELSDKSPTHLYAQDPSKPHEAFAEAFAHMVFGKAVDHELQRVVEKTIDDLKNPQN